MVRISAMSEMYIEITALMATFWACNTAMKYIYYHQASDLFSNTLIAATLCYLAIPFITFANIAHPKLAKFWRNYQGLRKSKILLFTIIEGFLSGYILSNREYQQTPPFVWSVPLGIAIATYTEHFNIGACPEKLLFVTVGTGAINELVFGLIVGITFSYLCISAIYVMIGFFAVQFYILKYREERVSTNLLRIEIFDEKP